MTDYIENAVNAAKDLGESYSKFNQLMSEQYKVTDELREQQEDLNKSFKEASTDSYDQFVNDRVDQLEQGISQMHEYNKSYNSSFADSIKESQNEYLKWLRISVDSFKESCKFETAQKEQMEKTFKDFYASIEKSQEDSSTWLQNYQYPFAVTETAKATKSSSKKKAV